MYHKSKETLSNGRLLHISRFVPALSAAAEGDVHGGGVLLGGFEVGRPLVVEVDVRTQLLQDTAFVHTAERERLVDRDVPVAARGGESPLRRAVARRDDGGAQEPVVFRVRAAAVLLHGMQTAEFGEEVGERAGAERDARLGGLGFPELVDAAALEDLFRAVVGEYAVEIERHAQFVVVLVVVEFAVQHIARGESAPDGVAHVGLVA